MGEGPRGAALPGLLPQPAMAKRGGPGVCILQCAEWRGEDAARPESGPRVASVWVLSTRSAKPGMSGDGSGAGPVPPESFCPVPTAYRPVDDELSGGSTPSAESRGCHRGCYQGQDTDVACEWAVTGRSLAPVPVQQTRTGTPLQTGPSCVLQRALGVWALESRETGHQVPLCHLLAVCPWASYVTSLSLIPLSLG